MTRAFSGCWMVVMMGLLGTGCEQTPFGETRQTQKKAGSVSPDLQPAQVRRGHTIYARHCLACHGESGKGTVLDWRIRDADGHLPPPPLDGKARTSHYPTSALLDIVREGSPPGQGKMPAWKNQLSERDMRDVVAYIKSLWSAQVYQLWWSIERQSQEG